MSFELRTSASRYKFIQDRVKSVEKHFGDFCQAFGALSRKYSKLRDKGDELSKYILDYSDTITYNSSSKAAMRALSQELALIQDYQDVKVKRLDALVIDRLRLYNTFIKQSKTDIKEAHDAADKEQKTRQQVEHVKEKKPSDARQITKVEIQHQKALVDASQSSRALEEAIDTFEQKKLRDLKEVFSSYVTTEMSFHAKSLETLTKCYERIQVINEADDLQEFRSVLHPSTATERLALMKSTAATGSRLSLTSTASRGDGPSFLATDSPRRADGRTPSSSSTPSGGSKMATSTVPATPTTSTHARVIQQSMLGDDDDDEDDESEDDSGDDDDSDYEEDVPPTRT